HLYGRRVSPSSRSSRVFLPFLVAADLLSAAVGRSGTTKEKTASPAPIATIDANNTAPAIFNLVQAKPDKAASLMTATGADTALPAFPVATQSQAARAVASPRAAGTETVTRCRFKSAGIMPTDRSKPRRLSRFRSRSRACSSRSATAPLQHSSCLAVSAYDIPSR